MNNIWKSANTVTTFSKVLALALFVALPFIGFKVGYDYGYYMGKSYEIISNYPVTITPTESNVDCDSLYNEIENFIDDSNYCEEDEDCDTLILAGSYIEFGCYHFINKDVDKQNIYDLMDLYNEACNKVINECAPSPRSRCEENRCVEDEESSGYLYDQIAYSSYYEPDPESYVGFQVSGEFPSTSIVYGIEVSKVPELSFGKQYHIYFNECSVTEAAAGTTYCIVTGDVMVEKI